MRYREVSVNGPAGFVLYLYILQVGFVYFSWAPRSCWVAIKIPRSSNHPSQVKPSFIIYLFIFILEIMWNFDYKHFCCNAEILCFFFFKEEIRVVELTKIHVLFLLFI